MKDLIAALVNLVLPWDAVSGMRIVLDGINGRILFYNAANELVLSAAPGNGTDPSGNPIKRGFTSYEPGAGDSYATLDSGTISINSFDDLIHTQIQQGLIQFTENDFIGSLVQINMDGDLGLNFRCSEQLRRGVWNGQDGFFYAGTGLAGDSYEKEEWEALGIIPGWGNTGAPYSNAEYKLGPDGRVNLRGMIDGGALADGTLVAGMPAAYAPPAVSIFPVATAAPAVHGGVAIDSTGSINIYGGITSISFEGLSYSIV